jgi:pimeloyl-ACP methyl ester carboxylesterase
MHFQCSAAASERGYNVLAFDGPGQGGAVQRQGLSFRPDWENVVGPVIDYPLTLPGVDGDKLALWGLSMGGVLAPRAAAFEYRLAALICVDGLYDMAALPLTLGPFGDVPDLNRRLRAEHDAEMDAELARQVEASPVTRWAINQAMWCFGVATPRAAFAALLDYNVRDGIAEKIKCPALICDGVNDLFARGQARVLFDHLTCPKTFIEFTEEEGADEHCQVGAQRLAVARVCNWLDDTLNWVDAALDSPARL